MTIQTIYRTAMQGADIHLLIEQMAGLLGRSLVITDKSYRVLAYSAERPVSDPLWKNIIARGYGSYEFMQAVEELIPSPESIHSADAFLVNCYASEENKLVSPLVYERQLIGYLMLLDNCRGIPEEAFHLLPELSEIAVFSLRQSGIFKRLFGNVSETILKELFETGNTEMAAQRFHASGITLSEDYDSVALIPGELPSTTCSYMIRTLRDHFPDALCIVHDNIVYSLIPAWHKADQFFPAFDDLRIAARKIGIGPRISRVSEYHDALQLAARACQISSLLEHKEQICRYEAFQFYDLLLSVPDRSVIRRNVPPSVLILKKYDLQTGNALLNTLRCFLHHNQNVNDTAADLYIHRNTLSYRLSKIRKLAGIDFEDAEVCFQLQCAFKILDILSIV